MNSTIILINGIAIIGFIIALLKDKRKALFSLRISFRSFIRMLPMVLVIILVIGLLLGFIPPDEISRFIGEQSGISGVILVGVVGAFMHIPSLLSFPLAASLLENGASVTAVAAFITTLTMIGMITLPLEIKELGRKMALLRNGLSFLLALIIAFIIGLVR